MSDHRYPLAYRFEAKANLTKDELVASDKGGCDAAVFASITYGDDGSRSQQLFTLDGKTGGDLSGMELFKTWALMTSALSERQDLPPGHHEFCAQVFDVLRCATLGTVHRATMARAMRAYLKFIEEGAPFE